MRVWDDEMQPGMNLETYRSISSNDSLVLANLGTVLVHIIIMQ